MQQLTFSGAEYAERFGLVCRNLFPNEEWNECRTSIKKSWEALSSIRKTWKAPELTWEEAQPMIHKAWAAAG